MQDTNKQLLSQSVAGMRFIAMATLYNRGDFGRLRQYFSEYFSPALFEEQSLSSQVALLKAQRRLYGGLRVRQVVGVGKYEVVVLVESQVEERLSVFHLAVDEEYPHMVFRFNLEGS